MQSSEKTPYYITTAISYPNGRPHIGHAYEVIATDAMARFKRLDGYDVRFLTGTDEHGQKMQQTADKEGIDVRALADRNAELFKELQPALNITLDRFIRTTDEDHTKAAQVIWQRMEEAGDIYLDTYAGWYSVRDEAYYGEEETELRDDGVRYSRESGTPVEWTEEETFFFRLSAYRDRLLALYEEHPEFIGPVQRRNEVASFVRGDLRDLSISRTTFDWGVPVPGHPDHVMYVWVDALTNYLTGTGFPETESESYKTYWPADLHVIGKDIARFHAVYWPAFLMSASLPLPKRVYAHGFLFNKGEKMSKSVGNVVDPFALINAYGLDQLRFFLLREVPFGQDGSYSHDGIVGRMNADLANDLGNLAQRSLSMVAKNCDGKVPEPGSLAEADEELLAKSQALLDKCRSHFEVQDFHRALDSIWTVIGETNRYFSAQQPWVLRKTDPERMNSVLYTTLEVLRVAAILVQPVMPESAGKLLTMLGQDDGGARDFAALGTPIVPGTDLPKPAPVFPRYEEPEA